MLKLCDTAQVADDHGLRVDVEGLGALAVFRHQGSYYVTDDTCTHGAASLCEGQVFGDEVECPFHHGAFNFRSGAATARPCIKPLKTYPVQVIDGSVFIER